MYNEPSDLEYGRMMSEANRAISTDGFVCTHNNAGWLGYYITTPNGAKYQLVKKSAFGNDGYRLCEYSPKPFCFGKPTELEFKDLEECKKYLAFQEKKEVFV